MPEESEIDTDKLQETIHEEAQREGGSLLRAIALTTTILTAFAAVAALAALTRLRMVRVGSLLLGYVGVSLFGWQLLA